MNKVGTSKGWLLLVLLWLFVGSKAWGEEYNRITVSGSGAVAVTPDTLQFSLYLEERGALASKLNDTINQKSEQLLNVLLEQGVLKSDIQSLQINLQPWYDNRSARNTVQGFILTRHINVVLRRVSGFAKLLDSVMRVGVHRVDNFNYRYSDTGPLYQEALEKAVSNAKLRAKKLSDSADRKLGEVLTIEELSQYSPRVQRTESFTATSFRDGGGYLPGQIEIKADLRVTFKLQ